LNDAIWQHAGAPMKREARGAKARRVVIVDLNNFATFPTLAIGLLTGALRDAGHSVQVVCPLAHDVMAPPRERRENLLDHLKRRFHLSTHPLARLPRDFARKLRTLLKEHPHPTTLRQVGLALDSGPDILLLSAYLQHHVTVREICHLARTRGVPVLLGGPMFAEATVARAWSSVPGLAGIVGAEVDRDLPELVAAVCEGRDIGGYAGVTGRTGTRRTSARPLRKLDETPIPDFRDFPWTRYPVRIVPVMSGRGCQWDKCLFCSDVISTSGRTFRTRSLESLLGEMEEQSRRHETRNFLFLDLKLNSNPDMLRGIAASIQERIPGAEWIGTVHVDLRRDNGLSRADLANAVAGGMRRISFGLESGSQRLLDLMLKGSSVEANSEFIRNAYSAGLSIRCTMFKGFPGETADDMEQTARFLEAHAQYLDRVRMNDFTVHVGTPIHRTLVTDGDLHGKGQVNTVKAVAGYDNPGGADPAYRRAKARALRAVYEINRRPIREAARQFDGLM
jgi:anaerobic magnesium-protoporphyrin IX monomethyl ester cyclase